MATVEVPLHWIVEYVVTHSSKFNAKFIQRLLDDTALRPDQPQIPPLVLIALLTRIFSLPNSVRACDVDLNVELSIEYLEQIERQRSKRIKALEKRGGPKVKQFTDTSESTFKRYNYALTGIKYWTVWNEMSRVPFSPYNTLALIASLYPQESISQAQTQEEKTEDEKGRSDLTSLSNHLSKPFASLSEERRLTFDVSKHPTLLKNTGKMPWDKVQNVLLTYLKQVGVVFERSESLINPERRIHGVKVDYKMIQIAAEELQSKWEDNKS